MNFQYGMARNLIKLAFTALALAMWQVYFQNLWNAYLKSQNVSSSIGTIALGYSMVLAVAWLLAWVINRKLTPFGGGDMPSLE